MNVEEARKILNTSPNATIDDLKLKYRKLVLKYHPDKCGDSIKFLQIKEAYDVLLKELLKPIIETLQIYTQPTTFTNDTTNTNFTWTWSTNG